MGSSEEAKSSKPEKPSSPPADQANVHIYPDWAAMQAYYGPSVAVPPYFNSAVATGHAPHTYMWGPQPMMPPYGTPYAAIYAHGGVYAHPGVPIATMPNVETPTKSSGNTNQGLMKKLKGFDGLAMSIGNNGNVETDEGGNHARSHSEETEVSSDASDGNTSVTGQNGRGRSCEETPTTDGNGRTENGVKRKGVLVKVNASPSAENVAKPITALELRNPPNAKGSPTTPPQPCAMISNEARMLDERELKRERRKQSNRESARRSRLRKQAEAEELAKRVESLTAENMTLKSEIIRLNENSVKLKLENTMLTEKLKKFQGEQAENLIITKEDKKRVLISTENLLSRVSNSGSVDRNDEGGEMYDKNSKSGARLRQLLDANPRTDAVAAS